MKMKEKSLKPKEEVKLIGQVNEIVEKNEFNRVENKNVQDILRDNILARAERGGHVFQDRESTVNKIAQMYKYYSILSVAYNIAYQKATSSYYQKPTREDKKKCAEISKIFLKYQSLLESRIEEFGKDVVGLERDRSNNTSAIMRMLGDAWQKDLKVDRGNKMKETHAQQVAKLAPKVDINHKEAIKQVEGKIDQERMQETEKEMTE